jgi:hypothetical protein
MLFLLLAGLVAAGFWFFNQIMKGITEDPTEVMRRLKEQFPTAELPPGFTARAGFRMRMVIEIDLLIFAKGEAQVDEEGGIVAANAMLLFRAKVPGDQPQDMAFDHFGRQQRLIEKRPYPLRVDGYEFESYWQKIVDRNQLTRVQIAVVLHPDTILVMQGDAENVDEKALRQFLKTIAPACRSAKRVPPENDVKRPGDKDGPDASDRNQKPAAGKKEDPPAQHHGPPEKKAVPNGNPSAPSHPDEKKARPEPTPPEFLGHAPVRPDQARTARKILISSRRSGPGPC